MAAEILRTFASLVSSLPCLKGYHDKDYNDQRVRELEESVAQLKHDVLCLSSDKANKASMEICNTNIELLKQSITINADQLKTNDQVTTELRDINIHNVAQLDNLNERIKDVEYSKRKLQKRVDQNTNQLSYINGIVLSKRDSWRI